MAADPHTDSLTVVIPVWDDYLRWLPECVDSVWSQRHETPLRTLVIDNASRAPLPPLPAGVQIRRTPRRLSLGAARNHGLAHLSTPFVAFADADDLFPPGYFAFALERLQARPELVAVGTRPLALDNQTGHERPLPWPTDGAIAASRHRRRLAVRGLLKEPSIVMSGSTFRTSALRRAGGYSDLNYGEDANLALLLPFLGHVELHRTPNRRYRIHPDSIARRPPTRATLEATYADARRRLRSHPSVPLWAKFLLPAVKRYHDRRIQTALDGSYADHLPLTPLTSRPATRNDIPALVPLTRAAIDELQKSHLDEAQITSSRAIMSLDPQLIDDGTYFVVECDGQLAGCGGWSRRASFYSDGCDSEMLVPPRDPARIRAMYTHPDYTRRGIARLILSLSEAAAAAEGFTRLELISTLAGAPLYTAAGFKPIENLANATGGAPVPLIRMHKAIPGHARAD